MSPNPKRPHPLEPVVGGGYCIGCGACAAVDPSIRIGFNKHRQFQATLPSEVAGDGSAAASVCPFASGNPNETDLGKELYGATADFDPKIGHHLATYAGWVEESDFRSAGSSGGMGSWVLCELLGRGLVDRVALVEASEPNAAGDPLFRYTVVSTPDEVRKNAKSRYHPIELSGIVRMMLDHDERYAVVGIPCFLKALRLLCRQQPVLRKRVAFTVGLVCGHLKSAAFGELLAWQVGIKPQELRAIDFRRKIPGERSSQYGITARGLVDGREETRFGANRDLFGSNWGLGFFKYKACEFCDDVMAELADITIGDAWLPEYEDDDRGTNVIVVRQPELLKMCREAADSGRIHLDPLSTDRVVASQAGGFRHRRDGLAYRLHLTQAVGLWHPPKRVEAAADHLPRRRKELLRQRYRMFELSHEAFAEARAKGDLSLFIKRMKPLSAAHGRLVQSPRKALVNTCKRLILDVLRALRIERWVKRLRKP